MLTFTLLRSPAWEGNAIISTRQGLRPPRTSRSFTTNLIIRIKILPDISQILIDWKISRGTLRRVPVPPVVQRGAVFSKKPTWIFNCNIWKHTHTHTGINVLCVLETNVNVTVTRYQTCWLSFNIWEHWWRRCNVSLFSLLSGQECFGSVWIFLFLEQSCMKCKKTF